MKIIHKMYEETRTAVSNLIFEINKSVGILVMGKLTGIPDMHLRFLIVGEPVHGVKHYLARLLYLYQVIENYKHKEIKKNFYNYLEEVYQVNLSAEPRVYEFEPATYSEKHGGKVCRI